MLYSDNYLCPTQLELATQNKALAQQQADAARREKDRLEDMKRREQTRIIEVCRLARSEMTYCTYSIHFMIPFMAFFVHLLSLN